MTTTKLTGREYLRVSQDRSGRARSIDEQHDDNERAAEAHGFILNGKLYSDTSISASRYGTKVRGQFGDLLADLEHDRFGADILVLWESSRGSRKVGEWVTLIELCETAGVRIHVTTHGRTYDPANARDRRSMLEDAVDSAYQSDKASDAIQRAAAATAARGEPHGRIPYGYTRSYDPKTRKLVSQDPEPAEAAIVREIFARLRKGHSLRSIASDFAERGVRTRTGKPFEASHLRDIALRPIYGGLRIHEPGNRSGRYHGSLDGAVTATWKPLVDRETFSAVRAMLTAPERLTSRPGRARHLLSLIAACDVCSGKLSVSYRRHDDRRRMYECRERSCVRIGADALDQYAERVMLAYLARDDVIAQLRAGPSRDDEELAKVRGDLEAARAELMSLRKLGSKPVGDPQRLSAASVAAIEPGLASQITGLEERERELTTPHALAGIITPGKDVARRWKAAPMPARREVARMLCSPAMLGQLRVGRSPKPGHDVAPELRVTWGTA
jgi:DNA invertase Pin-like site-specific DNA recombinase